MKWMRRLGVLLLIALCIAPLAWAKKEPKVATGPLDDGRLDPAWFGSKVAFVEVDEIDYLWVKEGFAVDGHKFHFQPWGEPTFIGESADDRDADDRMLARDMNERMAWLFSEALGDAFSGKATTSTDDGDVLVVGRIVDCSTGNVAAKTFIGFGAGSGNTTIDVKFTDKASGELLVALHHRVVSGTNWSNTESKFGKWIREMGKDVAKKGFSNLYQKGDPVSE